MRRLGVAAIALIAAWPAQAEIDCTAYLVGDWAGRGKVQFMGEREVESAWSYRANGTFNGSTKYVKMDGTWSDTQLSKGMWTAKIGPEPDVCIVRTIQKEENMESDFEIDINIVDNNSHRIMGLLVARQK